MQPSEKAEMVKILAGLSAIKPGGKLTPEAYEVWWLAMSSWPLAQFKQAASLLARTVEFMPSPYHFEQLRKASRPTAGEAWADALSHAASGSWRSGGTGDYHTDRAVRAIGGWVAIAMCDEDKTHFLERRFAEHFETMMDAEDTREAVPLIAGPSRASLSGPMSLGRLMSGIGREREDA